MRFILALLFVAACGSGPQRIDFGPVDCTTCEPPKVPEPYHTDLKPFIEEFVAEAHKRGVELNGVESIEFQDGDLEGSENVLGVCYTAGKRRWIRISSEWWSEMTDVYKRQLIFHEYGHCGLTRPHYDEAFEDNGKTYYSIMTTYISFGYDKKVTQEWPVLVEELFNPGKYHNAALHGHSLVDHKCFITPEGYTACPISVK